MGVGWAHLDRMGRFAEALLEDVLIKPTFPTLVVRAVLEQAQANTLKNEAGVLSTHTWAAQDGLDWEDEQVNLDEEAERSQARGITGPLELPDPDDPDGDPDPDDPDAKKKPEIVAENFPSRELGAKRPPTSGRK